MALTTAIFVGETSNWVKEIIPKAQSFKIGAGNEEGIDLSPVCYKELKEKIVQSVGTA
jgi:malonate-semialdehyde dehydrogenase (acetylating)/methylmalonate-semialdehyde dehydrogenase